MLGQKASQTYTADITLLHRSVTGPPNYPPFNFAQCSSSRVQLDVTVIGREVKSDPSCAVRYDLCRARQAGLTL